MSTVDFKHQKLTPTGCKDFHSVDRELYATLVFDLWRDPTEAIQMMAIWIWLGRVARVFPGLTRMILTLPRQLIEKVGDEALFCWMCIANVRLLVSSSVADFPLTNILLRKDMPIEFISKYRNVSIVGINEVVGVCAVRLKDIWDAAIARNAHMDFLQSKGNQEPTVAIQKVDIQPDERTLFVTFSRGHPVSEWEVREFFTGLFGECIESFYMQEVAIGEHALFAKIVLYHTSYIHAVLSGGTKAKFTINGKHMWMRKFIPKRR